MTILCLHRRNGEDHPEWSSLPVPEDKKFADLARSKFTPKRYLSDDQAFFRFDVKKAAKVLTESTLTNKARYMQLLSIMENNSDTYLYIH